MKAKHGLLFLALTSPALFATSAFGQAVSCSGTWPVPGTTVSGNTTTTIGYVGSDKVTVIKTVDNGLVFKIETVTKEMADCHNGFWRNYATAASERKRSQPGITFLDQRLVEAEQSVFDSLGGLVSKTVTDSKYKMESIDDAMNCAVGGSVVVTGASASYHDWDFGVTEGAPDNALFADATVEIDRPNYTNFLSFTLEHDNNIPGLTGLFSHQIDTEISGGNTIRFTAQGDLSDDNIPNAYWRSREYLIGSTPPAWTEAGNPRQTFINYANAQTMIMSIDEMAGSPDLLLFDQAFECQYPFVPDAG